jgi:endonuclease/exonuclease/phosphatase family metal-dependent hydrolase
MRGPAAAPLRKDPTPRKTVEAIIKAREAGKTLRAIVEHYGLSESGVSRIVKKNRRAKADA